MFEGLYFEHPKFFTFIVVYIACEAYCKLRSSALYFPNTSRFTHETVGVSTLMWVLKWLSIVLLIIAFMSPVKDDPLTLDSGEGYDIVMAIDASASMLTRHFDTAVAEMSRFDAVQKIATSFVLSRKDDNLGLVIFGDDAFIASPLTFDKEAFTQIVAHLKAGVVGRSTAIYAAVAQAVNVVKDSKAKSKVVILLSDGHNTAGGQIPLGTALALAQKEKVRFYTIGIGSDNEYDAPLLRYIAKESGGKSFTAVSAEELQEIYSEIDTLEKSEIEHFDYVFKTHLYVYPLFLAFFTLLIYVYLRNKRGWL